MILSERDARVEWIISRAPPRARNGSRLALAEGKSGNAPKAPSLDTCAQNPLRKVTPSRAEIPTNQSAGQTARRGRGHSRDPAGATGSAARIPSDPACPERKTPNSFRIRTTIGRPGHARSGSGKRLANPAYRLTKAFFQPRPYFSGRRSRPLPGATNGSADVCLSRYRRSIRL